MEINTLIIGHEPLNDLAGKKPRDIKYDEYFKALLSEFDIGTVHYASYSDWKSKVDAIHPLVIVSLGGDYSAREIKEYSEDSLLYVAEAPSSVFYRKANAEEKMEKNRGILTEIADVLKNIREGGEKELEVARHYASLSYNDLYKMITRAIIGDDEELRKKAWGLLMDNNGRSDFVWMRVQLIAETWEHSDGKQREQLMCMSMEHHIDNGIARKMDDFTDIDGKKYHQYMFCDPLGYDLNYIRRIPFGEKGQDKYAYEALLEKSEISTNFIRLQLEANQMKDHKEKYLKTECEKVTRVLEAWKEDPKRSKKELGVVPWNEWDDVNEPLTKRELQALQNFIEKHSEVAGEKHSKKV